MKILSKNNFSSILAMLQDIEIRTKYLPLIRMNLSNEVKAILGRIKYFYNRADECALNKQTTN